MNSGMDDLPPDLSRLGEQLTAAIDDSLRRRLARSLLNRIATSGAVGALLFVGITAASLHPADVMHVTPAFTSTYGALPALGDDSHMTRLQCGLPEHGVGDNSCVEVAVPMSPWRPEQLSG
jgi:hypothetical protein